MKTERQRKRNETVLHATETGTFLSATVAVANVSVGVVLLVDALVTAVAEDLAVGSVVRGIKLPRVVVIADFDENSWCTPIIDCCSCTENTLACSISLSIASLLAKLHNVVMHGCCFCCSLWKLVVFLGGMW